MSQQLAQQAAAARRKAEQDAQAREQASGQSQSNTNSNTSGGSSVIDSVVTNPETTQLPTLEHSTPKPSLDDLIDEQVVVRQRNKYTPFNPIIGNTLEVEETGESYTLLERLGKGGDGVSFKSEDSHGELKVVKIRGYTEVDDATEREIRFKKKYFKLNRAMHHLGIEYESHKVSAFQVVTIGNYVPGINLEEEQLKLNRLSNEEDVFSDLANLIETYLVPLHKEGILHGDLTHRNLIRTEDVTIKPIDFGDSKREDTQTMTTRHRATAGFALDGGDTTRQHDYYSLAQVAMFQLTGEVPLPLPVERYRNDYNEGRLKDLNISNETKYILRKMLCLDKPYDDPQTIANDIMFNLGKVIADDKEENNVSENSSGSEVDSLDEIIDPYAKENLINEIKTLKTKASLPDQIFEVGMGCVFGILGLGVSIATFDFSISHSLGIGASAGLAGYCVTKSVPYYHILKDRKRLKQINREFFLLDAKEKFSKEVVELETRKYDLIQRDKRDNWLVPLTSALAVGASWFGWYGIATSASELIPYFAMGIGALNAPFFVTAVNRFEKRLDSKSLDQKIAEAKVPEELKLGENFDHARFSKYFVPLCKDFDNRDIKLIKDPYHGGMAVRVYVGAHFRPNTDNPANSYIVFSPREKGLATHYTQDVSVDSSELPSQLGLSSFIRSKKEFDKKPNLQYNNYRLIKKAIKKLRKKYPEVYCTLRSMLPEEPLTFYEEEKPKLKKKRTLPVPKIFSKKVPKKSKEYLESEELVNKVLSAEYQSIDDRCSKYAETLNHIIFNNIEPQHRYSESMNFHQCMGFVIIGDDSSDQRIYELEDQVKSNGVDQSVLENLILPLIKDLHKRKNPSPTDVMLGTLDNVIEGHEDKEITKKEKFNFGPRGFLGRLGDLLVGATPEQREYLDLVHVLDSKVNGDGFQKKELEDKLKQFKVLAFKQGVGVNRIESMIDDYKKLNRENRIDFLDQQSTTLAQEGDPTYRVFYDEYSELSGRSSNHLENVFLLNEALNHQYGDFEFRILKYDKLLKLFTRRYVHLSYDSMVDFNKNLSLCLYGIKNSNEESYINGIMDLKSRLSCYGQGLRKDVKKFIIPLIEDLYNKKQEELKK